MTFTSSRLLAASALVLSLAASSVEAGVLGRYELAQPLVNENALPTSVSKSKALHDRALALADTALGQVEGLDKRIVPTLSCNGYEHRGTLQIVSRNTGKAKNAAFEGVRNSDRGLQMLDVGHGNTDAPAQQYIFNACNSSFMKYHESDQQAATIYYGHLRWNQSPHHCVAANQLASATSRVVNDMCSLSDDSSQMLQTWSLTRQPSRDGSQGDEFHLAFLGQPQDDPNGDFNGKYTLGRETNAANGQGTHYVTIKYSQDESVASAYYLKLA